MSLRRWLWLELATLTVAAVGGVALGFGWPSAAWCSRAASKPEESGTYSVLGQDLEPFRSEFNAAPDHVRAVLLVGPT
jgi:hypothetical protein